MKRLFATIALALFHSYGLRRTVVFHTVKVQVKTDDFLQTIWSTYKLGVAQQLHMASYLKKQVNCKKIAYKLYETHLEVIFFLTNKRIISVGEVKALVGVHFVLRRGPKLQNQQYRLR